MTYGVPAHIRSDNGSEFTAALVRRWLEALHVQTLFIEPGSPWENGYGESFNGKLRHELLDREIFYTLTEAKVLIERWRREYNTVRPHSALVVRHVIIFGYTDLSLQRASSTFICQSTPRCLPLTSVDHADTSSWSVLSSPMRRRRRHWRVIELSSFSAMFSQLPCFGVWQNSMRRTSCRARVGSNTS